MSTTRANLEFVLTLDTKIVAGTDTMLKELRVVCREVVVETFPELFNHGVVLLSGAALSSIHARETAAAVLFPVELACGATVFRFVKQKN